VHSNCLYLEEFVSLNLSMEREGRIGKAISTGQELGTIYGRARLYAQVPLIPVLNVAGLGTSLLRPRKKALWYDLVETMDERSLMKGGSLDDTVSARPIIVLIPTDVIVSANEKNSFLVVTGKV
jgi:hypothetical protein